MLKIIIAPQIMYNSMRWRKGGTKKNMTKSIIYMFGCVITYGSKVKRLSKISPHLAPHQRCRIMFINRILIIRAMPVCGRLQKISRKMSP